MIRATPLLIVSATLDTGGAQRCVSTLLGRLDRRRVRPELALLRNEIGFHLPDDVPVHQLDYRGPRTLLGAVDRLRRLIQARKPDVVLSNITATNLIAGLALPRGGKIPRWIARVGNSTMHHESFLRLWGISWTYPRADHIVANSDGLSGELKSRYPRLSSRIQTLENPTDFGAIDRESNDTPVRIHSSKGPLLIAVGRLWRQKRYDVMLDAFALVRQHCDAELWICGDGPERPKLERQIHRLKLAGSVHLLGFCRNPHALVKQADLFLMTSDHEGSPNALIEAQGLGVPAVATKCPHGPDEIIEEGETGDLTPVGCPAAFANSILKLLSDDSQRHAMSAKAREIARAKFDAGHLCQSWQDLIVRNHLSRPVEPLNCQLCENHAGAVK